MCLLMVEGLSVETEGMTHGAGPGGRGVWDSGERREG